MFNKLFKFNKSTSQEQFWSWFSTRSDAYFDFEQNQEPLFDALIDALQRVQLGLSFEFGPKVDGVRDFVISADGDRELFLSVTQLVKSAPSLKQWKILAFRQRRDTESEIGLGEFTISPQQIYVFMVPDGDKIGIALFFENYEHIPEGVLATAAYLLLDNALGEYDIETKVGFIERLHLRECEDANSLFPFEDLPSKFDEFYAKSHN